MTTQQKKYTVQDVAKVSLYHIAQTIPHYLVQHNKEGDLWVIVDCMPELCCFL